MNDALLKSVQEICQRSEEVRLQCEIVHQKIQEIKEHNWKLHAKNQIVRKRVEEIWRQKLSVCDSFKRIR